jgi:hypothetical protein
MALEFANTSGSPNIDYITYSGVPSVSGLGTCSIVARLSGDSDCPFYGNAIAASSAGFSNDVALMRYITNNQIGASFRNGSSSPIAYISLTFDGALRSVIFTFDGSASPKIKAYLDGAAATVTDNHSNTTIGAGQSAMLVGGISGFRWNGKIAEAAIYNRVITPAEAAMHAAGYSCLKFPRGLIFYAPLIRDVQDIAGGLTGTITGTTVSDHPRIYA